MVRVACAGGGDRAFRRPHRRGACLPFTSAFRFRRWPPHCERDSWAGGAAACCGSYQGRKAFLPCCCSRRGEKDCAPHCFRAA
ncbi:hypothetical protein D6833_07775, partial [Candidatus Parcubacteria bacterium]